MEEGRKKVKTDRDDLDYYTLDYSDNENDEQQEEYENQQYIEIDNHNIKILTNIRLNMIQYCDDMALPLCDYLTPGAICEFFEFLIYSETLN